MKKCKKRNFKDHPLAIIIDFGLTKANTLTLSGKVCPDNMRRLKKNKKDMDLYIFGSVPPTPQIWIKTKKRHVVFWAF